MKVVRSVVVKAVDSVVSWVEYLVASWDEQKVELKDAMKVDHLVDGMVTSWDVVRDVHLVDVKVVDLATSRVLWRDKSSVEHWVADSVA